MGLNPINTSNFIFERFSNYAATTLLTNNKEINSQLKGLLRESDKFSKGPIIEATPSYATGKSILDLVNEGVLSESFRTFNSTSLPLERPLYIHQERAIRNICSKSRNVVVATGTGSGKTESFIIPIVDHLLRLKSKNQLGPGVKALLLYPMNALANDQMKRLRVLLENEPQINFGIYTGETEEKYTEAYEKFTRMHEKEPQKNELISREQMKETPPHILLTNYAMLEYLMLRPADNVLFQGKYAEDWKFIVIDEAHTYTGSNGIEMSMLLSRLKNTIGLKEGELRCILTSASLGSGRKDFPKVAGFAKKMFREEFTPEDVIEASKEGLEKGIVWGRLEEDLYEKILRTVEDKNQFNFKNLLEESKVPKKIVDKAFNNNTDLRAVAYDILRGDERIVNTINILEMGPVDFRDLSSTIFEGSKDPNDNMAALIDVCNYVRKSENHAPLIPARYHYFIRALEGAFLVLAEKPYVYLDRMNKVMIQEKEYKAFEMGTCRRCNGIYLVGEIITDEETAISYLIEYEDRYLEDSSEIEYFAILEDDNYVTTINEDELTEGVKLSHSPFDMFNLCSSCGSIKEAGLSLNCNCQDSNIVKLLRVKTSGGIVKNCGLCGGIYPKGPIVRRFFLAEDTVSSVLATALYNKIPNRPKKVHKKDEDYWFDLGDQREENINKQLLIFSDNRQSAAYFATYLNSSYEDMLVKSILTKVIIENKDACIDNKWSLEDFHKRVERFVLENGIFTGTVESLRRKIWKWIMGEFAKNSTNSLVNMGYLHFSPNYYVMNDYELLFRVPVLIDAGFNHEEINSIYKYIMEQFRQYRAIEYPEYVSPTDPYFFPVNRQGGFGRIIKGLTNKRKKGYEIKSWLPSNEKTINSRSDYLTKIYEAKGKKVDRKEINDLLDGLYKIITHKCSPFKPYIKHEIVPEYGYVIRFNPYIYKVSPGILDPEVTYYKCNKCHKLATINIEQVCPSYRCTGRLEKIDIMEEFRENHYRKLFTSFNFEKMDVSEHTAQLKTEYAAEIQNKFINGDINVLSCSTTFELGVDVGDLETVFMKNMPPTPANYAQRAGRAGRRTDSTAYALTYARLASHDFSNFKDPNKMISGTVKPPYFEVTNEKIARRHIYACALAEFWRENTKYFRTVDDFFFANKPSGPELLKEFLGNKPEKLYRLIKKVTPIGLHNQLKIDSWGWVDELYTEEGIMTKIRNEVVSDIARLEEVREQAAERRDYPAAGHIERTINTIKRRPLINYFSQKNLLPKYGFPVDVVSLEANFHTVDAKNVELNRDLQIAISEYAPESQIIANGKLWTSRYVKQIRQKNLIRKRFFSCSCGYFKSLMLEHNEEMKFCPVCKMNRVRKGIYMMPEFGFITDSAPRKPGNTRPERTYSSRKHFSGNGNLLEEKEFIIKGNRIQIRAQTHGQLTVINNGKGAGFEICNICGYGVVGERPTSHKNPAGEKCRGKFRRVALGYDFETDIVEIEFDDLPVALDWKNGFWESLMYAIIEGMSSALEIDRDDIDGTLYHKGPNLRSIILFDTVPGGAGHVNRLLEQEQFEETLQNALEKVSTCSCGGQKQDTSCYNCLRNYYNQYCHDKLKRSYAIQGLSNILNRQAAKTY